MREVGKYWTAMGLVVLGLAHLVLVCDVLWRKSPTVDEVAHLPAGISYLQQGTFQMYRLSPPLARLLPALAARTTGPRMDYTGTWQKHNPPSHWLFAMEFLAANGKTPADRQRYLEVFTRARMVMAVWSALTIPFLYWWGSWWFGRKAGWLAAGLWAFSPNIIAHAGMMTTDLPATSFALIASLFFCRWLDRPGWGRATVVGIWLGLAQLVKFGSLTLFPLWSLWALGYVIAGSRPPGVSIWSSLRHRVLPWRLLTTPVGRQFSGAMLLSILILDAGYSFEGILKPIGRFAFVSDLLTRPRTPTDGPPDSCSNRTYNAVYQYRVNRFRGTWLAGIPCPLPYHYVAGFDEQKFEADGGSVAISEPASGRGYQMYLQGELRRRGWWYYYPYAMLVKVPLTTWLLLAMTVSGSFCWPTGIRGKQGVLVLLVIGPLLAFSVLTDINIGLRYVLPVFPFLFLFGASTVHPGRPFWWNIVAGLALCGNLWSLARIHPHELSYFNELSGGPRNGRFHLIDSNLDWGQDLRGLARWLGENPDWIKKVRIAYMGTVPPEFEGITHYELVPRDLRKVPLERRLPWENEADPTSFGPQPGKFAVSVNFERGMAFHSPAPFESLPEIRRSNSQALQPDPMVWNPPGALAYFQYFEPRIEPEIGYSILLYDISPEDANRVREKLRMPLLGP